ncbi:hypothetical protein BC826DRAFT_966837 [Russula brevipes]|nr:hypothetical protein BC826DRAFT_966837 [Russula brevipes]
MANLIRSAKFGNDWTRNDLASYNITVNQMAPTTFFGLQELPPPSVDQELLAVADANDMQQALHAELINLLDLTMIPGSEESSAVDFSAKLFRVLGYDYWNRVARTRMSIDLFICGEKRHTKADNTILLLVQEDKRVFPGDPLDAQAQLVAGAVAAFNTNNASREAAGLPPLAEKVMPGIVMVGTSPSFFKIPVTQTLASHIAHGTYPPEEIA